MERGQPDTLIREEKTQTGQENGWKGNFKTLPPTHIPLCQIMWLPRRKPQGQTVPADGVSLQTAHFYKQHRHVANSAVGYGLRMWTAQH